MLDDCCGGKKRGIVPPTYTRHQHALDTATPKGMKPDDLHGRIERGGWWVDGTPIAKGKTKLTIWKRRTVPGAMTHNDTLVTLQEGEEIKLFRLSEVRPLDLILSGKAPPA